MFFRFLVIFTSNVLELSLIFIAVQGVLYYYSGGAGLNWNPNLPDPMFGFDYFLQQGNTTANNYFVSTVDISALNTITIEFWTSVIGIGLGAHLNLSIKLITLDTPEFSAYPQVPLFYGNQISYFALVLPNGVFTSKEFILLNNCC